MSTPFTPDPDALAPPDLLAGEALLPPPQQERSRAKRAALLAAALVLFGERGYEATTTATIAERAGIAVGGFYLHFVSKRQLLLVLMAQLLDEATRVAPPPPAIGGTIATMISAMVRQALQLDWAFAGAYRAWREAALQDAALATLNRAIERWSAAQLAHLVQPFATLPGARADVDVPSVASALSVLILRLAETPLHDPAEVERIVATLTHMILHTFFHDEYAAPGEQSAG